MFKSSTIIISNLILRCLLSCRYNINCMIFTERIENVPYCRPFCVFASKLINYFRFLCSHFTLSPFSSSLILFGNSKNFLKGEWESLPIFRTTPFAIKKCFIPSGASQIRRKISTICWLNMMTPTIREIEHKNPLLMLFKSSPFFSRWKVGWIAFDLNINSYHFHSPKATKTIFKSESRLLLLLLCEFCKLYEW